MRISVLALAFLGLGLAACTPPTAEKSEPKKEAAHTEHKHWTYANQAEWAGIDAKNAACAVGVTQSPIALISAAKVSDAPDLATRFAAGEGALLNNGHTLQFTPAAGAGMKVGDISYSLRQFHLHGPSEHTLDGQSFPLEIHFVHTDAAGGYAVLGVMVKEGAANPALAALIAGKPAAEGEAASTKVTLDPNVLLPASRVYFAYAGSLTTPPCSEGVKWHVLKDPITADAAQIAALTAALGKSNRDVQGLGARQVVMGQ
jgi:carbonic anhydrase